MLSQRSASYNFRYFACDPQIIRLILLFLLLYVLCLKRNRKTASLVKNLFQDTDQFFLFAPVKHRIHHRKPDTFFLRIGKLC